jgi:hypothetical protein
MFLPLERLPLCGGALVAHDLIRKPVSTFRDHAGTHYPRRRIDLTRTRDMVLPQPGDFVVLGPRSKEQAK